MFWRILACARRRSTATPAVLAMDRAFGALASRSHVLGSSSADVRPRLLQLLIPPAPFSRPRLLLMPRAGPAALVVPSRGNAGTKKKKLRPVQLRNEVKVASKRKGKHYKLKTHGGAAARWLIKSPRGIRGVVFKRAQAGRSHLNRKNRSWKTRSKRIRVVSNAQQKRLLKKLLPYHRKKYMR